MLSDELHIVRANENPHHYHLLPLEPGLADDDYFYQPAMCGETNIDATGWRRVEYVGTLGLLCPTCLDSLAIWFAGNKAEVARFSKALGQVKAQREAI